jgi:hypothetical protein
LSLFDALPLFLFGIICKIKHKQCQGFFYFW